MEEEQTCPEAIRCANNCGFFGSPATLNLCSKCYRDHVKTEQDLISVEKSLFKSSLSPSSSSPIADLSSDPPSAVEAAVSSPVPGDGPAPEGPKRCTACRKKVGLTGFRCRCGSTFCGSHRFPEQHECGFDHKAAGRAEIARSNPVVQAEKLRKI